MEQASDTAPQLLCILARFVEYIDGRKGRSTFDSTTTFLHDLQEKRGVNLYPTLQKWRKKDEIIDPSFRKDVTSLERSGLVRVDANWIVLTRKGRKEARSSSGKCPPALLDEKALDVATDNAGDKYIITCRTCKAVINFKWSWWHTRFGNGENTSTGWCKCPRFHTLRASDFD